MRMADGQNDTSLELPGFRKASGTAQERVRRYPDRTSSICLAASRHGAPVVSGRIWRSRSAKRRTGCGRRGAPHSAASLSGCLAAPEKSVAARSDIYFGRPRRTTIPPISGECRRSRVTHVAFLKEGIGERWCDAVCPPQHLQEGHPLPWMEPVEDAETGTTPTTGGPAERKAEEATRTPLPPRSATEDAEIALRHVAAKRQSGLRRQTPARRIPTIRSFPKLQWIESED